MAGTPRHDRRAMLAHLRRPAPTHIRVRRGPSPHIINQVRDTMVPATRREGDPQTPPDLLLNPQPAIDQVSYAMGVVAQATRLTIASSKSMSIGTPIHAFCGNRPMRPRSIRGRKFYLFPHQPREQHLVSAPKHVYTCYLPPNLSK